jgi:hypothetical protein
MFVIFGQQRNYTADELGFGMLRRMPTQKIVKAAGKI